MHTRMTSLTSFLWGCYLSSLLRPMLPSVGRFAISSDGYFFQGTQEQVWQMRHQWSTHWRSANMIFHNEYNLCFCFHLRFNSSVHTRSGWGEDWHWFGHRGTAVCGCPHWGLWQVDRLADDRGCEPAFWYVRWQGQVSTWILTKLGTDLK